MENKEYEAPDFEVLDFDTLPGVVNTSSGSASGHGFEGWD